MKGYTMNRDNLNHDHQRDDLVTVKRNGRTATPLAGKVITKNRDGSYGVRIGTGRAAKVIQCRKIELSKAVTS